MFLDGISVAVHIIQKFRKVLDGMQVYTKRIEENLRNNQYKVYGKYLLKSIFKKCNESISIEEIKQCLGEINRKAVENGVSFKEMFEQCP